MPIKIVWLPLAWLVATATVTVTRVFTLEPLLGEPPTPPAPPARTPAPSQDVGTSVLPVPTPSAHPEGLPGWGVTDGPSPTAPEGAPEELDTAADETTAVPTPGTSAPPCPGDEEPTDTCGEPTGEQRAAVAEALVTFAVRFYQHMAEAAQPDANLLFSPINVATGLSHLLLGARGETQERLAALLAYPPELDCVHGALQQLASTPGLFSAAQIFHHPELHLRPRFLNDSLRFYGARPYALSGNESLDLQRINAWVREASKGLLPSLLSALPPEPRLLLLSAVHLRAAWRTPLDRKKTVLLPFQRPGHPPRMVPTMTSAKYPVASFTDSRLQVQVGRLELNGGLSLVVLMPRGPLDPLETVERALDPTTFLALLRRAARTAPRATALSLPRLRLDIALDVVPVVHDMGKDTSDGTMGAEWAAGSHHSLCGDALCRMSRAPPLGVTFPKVPKTPNIPAPLMSPYIPVSPNYPCRLSCSQRPKHLPPPRCSPYPCVSPGAPQCPRCVPTSPLSSLPLASLRLHVPIPPVFSACHGAPGSPWCPLGPRCPGVPVCRGGGAEAGCRRFRAVPGRGAHRAVLALDEAGVEAAAAMATSVARSALVLEALRPFLFVLWHNTGEFPVFMGRLSDP
ncbi:plasma protease C1 inhibitor [Catharus ustulatus]|uniref:plasma protease C1 inhibitor n=1 Tax=Catharus ustulatus TaxID=91951 RepID=UPI00140AFE87|nr:plasma protease C1 inhibitor [Catharus ustulatus]